MSVNRNDRRRIGGAVARYFASGSGPSHANLNSAFARCGYQESQDAQDQSKEARVLQAFVDAGDPDFFNLMEEMLLLLQNYGSLENKLRVRRGSRRANDPWDYQELRTVPERRPRDLTSGGPLVNNTRDWPLHSNTQVSFSMSMNTLGGTIAIRQRNHCVPPQNQLYPRIRLPRKRWNRSARSFRLLETTIGNERSLSLMQGKIARSYFA